MKKIIESLNKTGEFIINKNASVCELKCPITNSTFYEVLHNEESTGILTRNINKISKLISEYKNEY